MADIAIGLHGGCGTLDRSLLSETEWTESRVHIAEALRAGWTILKSGGSAVDAVEATVVVLENSIHFNAGYGSALNELGEHELDAAIMNGADLSAGAICGVQRIKNPIRAARAVLEGGRAVLMNGASADDFAKNSGLAMVEPSWFTTPRRLASLASLKGRSASGTLATASEAEKHGTVGAVARDARGHLAAATSTGGFNNKPVGRVGDSPIIGAGTYADDATCAVSCTGQGEIFIRRVAAHDLAARIRYAGQTLSTAAEALIHETMSSHGIGAGLIAIGTEGEPVAPYNTLGMYRGWITTRGELTVATHDTLHTMELVS